LSGLPTLYNGSARIKRKTLASNCLLRAEKFKLRILFRAGEPDMIVPQLRPLPTGEKSQHQAAIYLDNHATTPIDPRVADVVLRVMIENFGNAHSVDHCHGQSAAALVEAAAEHVANLIHADSDHVRFTSGATEAIRLAVAMAADASPRLRVAVSRVEHKAVLDPLRALEHKGHAQLHWIDVDRDGCVVLDDLERIAEQGVDLVCVMAANNEVGTINPIKDVTKIAHSVGAKILVDATPAVGRLPINIDEMEIDYLVLSAHKIYGPKGAGALIAEDANTPLVEEVYGHLGTLNVPAIAGFGEACRIAMCEGEADRAHEARMRDNLSYALGQYVSHLVDNGARLNRLSNNLHISAPGAPNDAVLARLNGRVAISTGAACSSGAQEPSHVLRAMKMPALFQESALRISVGKFTTEKEIEFAAIEIARAIKDVRAAMETE